MHSGHLVIPPTLSYCLGLSMRSIKLESVPKCNWLADIRVMLMWVLIEIILKKTSAENSQHISLQIGIVHTCLNSAADRRSLQVCNCYVTLWKTAQQCNLRWDYLKEKERDIVRGERCHFQNIIRPRFLLSCHNSNISLHCRDFTRCPEHCNKSSGAGERRDVTGNFSAKLDG